MGPLFKILLAVILFSASFPPFYIPFAGMAGLGFFLHMLLNTSNIKQSFIGGFLFGLLFALATGKGVLFASLVHYGKTPMFATIFFAIAVAIPTGSLFGLFSAMVCFLEEKGHFHRLLAIPSIWTLLEYTREIIPISIPWANAGYSMMPILKYVQFADITGVYGVSFIMVASSSAGAGLFEDMAKEKDKIPTDLIKKKWKEASIFAVLLFIPIVYGHLRIKNIENKINDFGKPVFSACVQGNYSPSDRWKGLDFFGRLSTYESMTTDVLRKKQGLGIILWPESVLNMSDDSSYGIFDDLSGLIGKDSILVSGGKRKGAGGFFNSAYLITGKGSVSAYDKNLLLPYAEKSSASFKLGNFEAAPDVFLAGRTRPFVNAGELDLGMSICLEDLYPWYIRKSVNLGADILVNISADDWFGNTGSSEMHLDAARMRAIENRRYMVRCANSGISAIISATGEIEKRTSLFERESISGISYLLKHQSIYSGTGDVVIVFSALIIAFSFARIIFSKEMKNN